MRRKIVLPILMCTVILFIIAGCMQPDWTCEDFTYLGENVEMGPMFRVDGITYRYLPETFWRPVSGAEKYLGNVFSESDVYPGGKDFYIENFETNDTNKIFVVLNGRKEHWYDDMNRPMVYYYRADISLPPFDRAGINKIGYEKNGQWFDEIKPITQDTSIIDRLFDAIDSVSKEFDYYKSYGVRHDLVYEHEFSGDSYTGTHICIRAGITGRR